MSKVSVDRGVLEQVADAAYSTYCSQDIAKLVPALRAALEQPVQQPAATVSEVHMSRYTIEWTNGPLPEGTSLYAVPQDGTAPQPAQQAVADAAGKWRKLALQFDAHRMQALWHLKAMTKDPQAHMSKAVEFLSAPPPQPAQQPPRVGPGKTAEQTLAQWDHDLVNPPTPEQAEDFARRERAFAAQQPAQQAVSVWERFPGYLIDNHEGEIISEEGLQLALSEMLSDPKYTPQPVQQPAPRYEPTDEGIGND